MSRYYLRRGGRLPGCITADACSSPVEIATSVPRFRDPRTWQVGNSRRVDSFDAYCPELTPGRQNVVPGHVLR